MPACSPSMGTPSRSVPSFILPTGTHYRPLVLLFEKAQHNFSASVAEQGSLAIMTTIPCNQEALDLSRETAKKSSV